MRNEFRQSLAPPHDMIGAARGGRVTAVLGPTNTGKTHLAIERMLAHRSGMIGLPLRLLAREVYDKIVRLRGLSEVALITGEERIVPAHPRFYVCTVEAMPVDIPVAFLAIDEIQLCADLERGHVFTDRLLNARGDEETMLLGAGTMRRAIKRFVPQAQFVTRPRFSDLAYMGAKKLTRLPRRSAVVAFSAEDVYGLAELVRSQRGGAAVVMGALSPRTRNAQVALYQSGEVDFLIASDAIGMGINMDVDHVAFAATEKFDGMMVRPLKPEELGQIAGRAGRYMNDGTFGVTSDAAPLEAEIVSQIENHRYDPVRVLQWRNNDLDFGSLDSLLASLDEPPPLRGLMKARPSSDHWTLASLARDEDMRARVRGPASVKLLWQACQLPDFRKLTSDEHTNLVGQIVRHLMDRGVLPDAWLSHQIARLDIVEGDVDTLSARLAQIRTWTYAAHRPGWTGDPAYWQEMTRATEDRLSDALHEKLTQRFIDRRTAVLMRHLRDEEYLTLAIDESGAVAIGGEHVGKLEGFRFAPDPRAEGIHGRTLRAAALKGLETSIVERARALIAAADDAIHLSEHGQLWWQGAAIARLAGGAHPLSPAVAVMADDILRGEFRERVRARLEAWVQARITFLLQPLIALRSAAEDRNAAHPLPGVARGLAFQLGESLGHVDRRTASLPPDLRAAGKALAPFGVRIGRHAVYLPRLLKPAPASLAALLWAVHKRLGTIPSPPPPGRTSFAYDDSVPPAFLAAASFRVVGPRAVRCDIVERIDALLASAERKKTPAETLTPALTSMLGCGNEDALAVAKALGWRRRTKAQTKTPEETPISVWERRSDGARRRQAQSMTSIESPFAELSALITAS